MIENITYLSMKVGFYVLGFLNAVYASEIENWKQKIKLNVAGMVPADDSLLTWRSTKDRPDLS